MNPTTTTGRAAINRENAQKSTGPRTDEGKRQASRNALKHGLTGGPIVMPYEDPAAYEDFCHQYRDEFQPKGINETQLVQTLADCIWRMNRARVLEANALSSANYTMHSMYHTADPDPNVCDALALGRTALEYDKVVVNYGIYEQRLSRQYERTLKLLTEVQTARRQKERQDLEEAAMLCRQHEEAEAAKPAPQRVPYNPADDGFVFSLPEIYSHIRRAPRSVIPIAA